MQTPAGHAEAACFNLTPDYLMLVDYTAYMMSVAKLTGCEPRDNRPLKDPEHAVKAWTFPQWPCFFRTQGVGAKPEVVEAVLSKFGPYDALAPMPLLGLQLACGFAMPFVNLGSLAADTLLSRFKRGPLPKLYRWRVSKMYFLYQNSLTLDDFRGVPTQWVASWMVLSHLVKQRLPGWLTRREELQPSSAS